MSPFLIGGGGFWETWISFYFSPLVYWGKGGIEGPQVVLGKCNLI